MRVINTFEYVRTHTLLWLIDFRVYFCARWHSSSAILNNHKVCLWRYIDLFIYPTTSFALLYVMYLASILRHMRAFHKKSFCNEPVRNSSVRNMSLRNRSLRDKPLRSNYIRKNSYVI